MVKDATESIYTWHAILDTKPTMVMAKHQDAIFSEDLSQLLITPHVLSNSMCDEHHTPKREKKPAGHVQ